MKKEELYQCPICKVYYPTEELAKQCEDWCKENNSCNIEIIQHAVQPEDEDEK